MLRSFKCYRQLEHSDCGLTCIRMIAHHYGIRVPIKYLRKITDLNRLGMSMQDIIDCCDKIKLEAHAVKIDINKLKIMPLPAILYWQQRHFVVLYGRNSNAQCFKIADPAQGKMTYSCEEMQQYWIPKGAEKGLAIVTAPKSGFRDQSFKADTIISNFVTYIVSFMQRHRRNMLATALITLLIMSADIAVPVLFQRTIDDGIGSNDIGLVLALLLGQLSIAFGALIASNGINLLMTHSGLKMNLDMVSHFLARLSRFPLSFFDRKVSSDFVQKIDDQAQIRSFVLTFPNSILTMVITLIVFSIMLCYYSGWVFCAFMVLSLFEIGWNTLFLQQRKSIDYAQFIHSSANRNHAYELTNGMADLKVNNAETARINKWLTTQKSLNQVSMKSAKLSCIQNGGHTLLSRIKDLSVTGISAVMVINGDMTIGVMMTLGYIAGRLSQPFQTISQSINSFQDSLLSYQRIDDVLNDDDEQRGNIKYSNASIHFKNVWFKYAGAASPFVIKNITMTIEPGSITALVGESGCGKSTLIKLMLGFYIPQRGCLLLSGKSVKDVDNQDWLSHCGVVMQDGRIFTGSILENIALSDSEPDEDRVLALLKAVNLCEFIKTLPMGIHTQLGVSGIEISGGQKQRLLIARALYKEPDMLFLDEATSSLDATNERSIVESLKSLGGKRTLVIAAHRLSTVSHADKIIFIKNGEITESGTHQELLALQGDYWKLVKNQLQLSTD